MDRAKGVPSLIAKSIEGKARYWECPGEKASKSNMLIIIINAIKI